ncbi:MAG: LemA family protein [Candidatus Methylumidiphilus sp.]
MIFAGVVLLGLSAMAGLYVAVLYNRLVSLKHDTAKAWSNIDVLLKQRHDELPKLVETCRQFMAHERQTLEQIMLARAGVYAARKSGDMAVLGAAEGRLRRGLSNLFAVAGACPQLQASGAFRNLEARISGLENAIADRREYYNEVVNANNVRLEQFPDVIVARLFAFESADLLEFDAAETADVDIRALFG